MRKTKPIKSIKELKRIESKKKEEKITILDDGMNKKLEIYY